MWGQQSRSRAVVPFAALMLLWAIALLHAEDWSEWRGHGRQGIWNETGLLERFPPNGPAATWRTPVNSGYSGPAVSAGRVFVTDSKKTTGNRAIERALAIDERTGQILWTHEWPADYSGMQLVYAIGPRATPTVDAERVYVLGASGRLLALDVRTGAVAWEKNFVEDYDASIPSWGSASAPLVDGDRLICLVGGEPDGKVIAVDKRTGKEVWRALSSNTEPGYNQPIIIEAGGARQLIVFHPDGFSSINPATGTVLWEIEHRVQMGIVVATPVRSGPYLFFTSQYGGARMLRLDDSKPDAAVVWSGPGEQDPGMTRDAPNTINSVISTPVIDGDYIYGLDNNGELRCLEAATGRLVWKTDALLKERAVHGTAFFVRNGDRYFINNDRGELVIARLSPKGFEEIDRAKLLEPTHPYVRRRQMPGVLWSHPAYANKHIVIRNDREVARFSLASGS
jgi:outer membrane protein assembly factor BamB